jgi:hypothetical protein
MNLDRNILGFPGYNYESKINTVQPRMGVSINSSMNYVRLIDLEGKYGHFVIIYIKYKHEYMLINIY